MYLWDDNEWSERCKAADHSKVSAALESEGYTVRGFSNGKPEVEEEISAEELQSIVMNALSGQVAEKPQTDKPKSSKKKKKA